MGVLFVGVLLTSARFFGVYIRASELRKTPCKRMISTGALKRSPCHSFGVYIAMDGLGLSFKRTFRKETSVQSCWHLFSIDGAADGPK